MLYSYPIHRLIEYINWSYFFHAWQLGGNYASINRIHNCPACRNAWLRSLPHAEQARGTEALKLYDDAQTILRSFDAENYRIQGITRLFPANSEQDDLLLFSDKSAGFPNAQSPFRIPLLRQQTPASADAPCLCLSDFIRPLSSGIRDCIGLFATAADPEMEKPDPDPYRRMLRQTLSDRLAEAAAERMHLEVRRTQWGYAPDENLSISELHSEHFQGIRPAIGYPSLPDQSIIFLIDRILPLSRIGIRLTESGAMQPHAAVCGLMIGHPRARYFHIGRISSEQLADYARRRNLPAEDIRRFLSGNL